MVKIGQKRYRKWNWNFSFLWFLLHFYFRVWFSLIFFILEWEERDGKIGPSTMSERERERKMIKKNLITRDILLSPKNERNTLQLTLIEIFYNSQISWNLMKSNKNRFYDILNQVMIWMWCQFNYSHVSNEIFN